MRFVLLGLASFVPLASALAEDELLVVTAERREKSLDQIPQSISVLGGDDLQRIDADHIAEALGRAPGVNIHRGSGAEHLTAIRSPVLTAGAGAGSFLFLENGVPLRSPGFANINGLFDAHYEIANAIEIVRGPSGALYGANAIHGVINVITPTPSEALFYFTEAYGDTQERLKFKGTVSGPHGANGYFAGASVVSEAGYRDNAGLDQQKFTLRHVREGDVKIDTIFSFDNLNQETAGFIFGREPLEDKDLRRTNDFPDSYREAQSARLQSTFEFDLSSRDIVKITPYARWNRMEFPQHFLPSNALERNGHWSIGVQSAWYGERDRLSLIAGIDAEYTQGWLFEFQSEPTVFSYTQGLHYDYDVRVMNASGFAQAEYQVTGDTIMTAAVRVDGTIYDYENNTNSGVVGRFLRPDDRTDRFVTASPKFSIRHQLEDDTSLYVSYTRGARPPQTTDLYRLQFNQIGSSARPETIDSVEMGLRTGLGDKGNIQLAGYFMEKDNFFFRDADGFNVTDGKTRHIGIEANVELKLQERLTLHSVMTYAAHTYRFDRITGNATETISNGDDVDTAPRVLANTRLLWRPVDTVTFEAEWAFVGSYFTDAANDHSYEGYNLINLRMHATIKEDLSAFIALRNATNSLYAERADFAFGEDRYFPAETRTLGIGLRLQR